MSKEISLNLKICNSTKFAIDKTKVEHLVLAFLSDEKISGEILLEIDFVGNKKMCDLNKQHRNVDKVTDVLSFPVFESADALKSAVSPKILGAIVICPVFCSVKNESIIDMILHGLIHLIGRDHERASEWVEWQNLVEKFWLRHQRS